MDNETNTTLRGIHKSLTEIAFYMRLKAKENYGFDDYTDAFKPDWDKRLIDTLNQIDREATKGA